MEIFLPIAHIDMSIWLILLFGAGIGLLSAALGVGGGFLLTPLLIFSGVPPIVAAASSATQIVGTSAAGSYTHWRLGNVDPKMAGVILLGSWTGAAGGVVLARILEKGGHFGTFVTFAYVITLTIVGVYMGLESIRSIRKSSGDAGHAAEPKPKPDGLGQKLPLQMTFPVSELSMSALVPFFLGLVVGILPAIGMGGGFVMVPLMIYVLKMPTKVAMGTSLFQLVLTTSLVSVLQAGLNHSVDPYLALGLIFASIFGVQIGARLSVILPAEKLRLVLALILIAVSVKMVLGILTPPSLPFAMTLGLK